MMVYLPRDAFNPTEIVFTSGKGKRTPIPFKSERFARSFDKFTPIENFDPALEEHVEQIGQWFMVMKTKIIQKANDLFLDRFKDFLAAEFDATKPGQTHGYYWYY